MFLMIASIPLSNARANEGYICSHGFHTFGDRTLTGGVGNYGYTDRYYWISPDLNSTYVTHTNNAVKSWVFTTSTIGVTTPISLLKTTTKSSSVFDVYNKYLGSKVFGQTRFYKCGTEVTVNNYGSLPIDYGYTAIEISTSECNSWLSSTQTQATIAHEFGHAMGLSHQNYNPSSIMHQYYINNEYRTATRAIANDLYTINHLY